MKFLAQRSSRDRTALAEIYRHISDGVVLGSIPGLERLLPGRHLPGSTVRSRYGSWTLPRSFKGRPISLIINGTMLG